MDYNANIMSLINQQLMEAEKDRQEHQASFDFLKHYIYTYPLTPDAGYRYSEAASIEAFGTEWQFMMIDPTNGGFYELITYEMMNQWNISINDLMNAVKENIGQYMPNAMGRILFGRPYKGTVMPFLKVYMADGTPVPPYGASLMLLDEVIDRIHKMIGDFCMYPADKLSFYALPAGETNRLNMNVMQALKGIMQYTPDGSPMMLKEERIFPEEKMKFDFYQ